MNDFEKLMALKKAYAEIIVGMAKEASARVMAAERRASQFQEELFDSKEQAMRLLLRLKQMCDAKLSEAETTSAWQQERIEELEARLQEAENTVKGLREELKEAQDKLENERTHKSHQVSETHTIGDTVKPEEALGGNRCDTSHSIGQSPSDSQTAFKVSEKRGKEAKLRRNKRSRKVRAIEKNSSAQPSFSGQEENVEHGTYGGAREGKVSAVVSNLLVDKRHGRKREPSVLKVMKADCNEVMKTVARKRKRTPRCRTKNTSWGKQHDWLWIKQRATDVFSFGASMESHPPCRLNSPSEATEVTEKSDALVIRKDAELVKSGIMVDATNRSKAPKESEIIRQGSGGIQHLNVSSATSGQDKIIDLPNSDLKASSANDGISGSPVENKFLKFTFSRRKKETSSHPNGTFRGADITPKKKGQTHDRSLKPENSALTCELSQDRQQLVQVAEQLMSLSKGKWN
ncbi:hypothetical protein BT93_K0325 [Corymbia citriodora subsp. variegata]|nr:hypothetical protein BT93_K0325 [Corymbia citriodora subsp. variegata]